MLRLGITSLLLVALHGGFEFWINVEGVGGGGWGGGPGIAGEGRAPGRQTMPTSICEAS